MAANKVQREIEIILNGQKVNSSLKEMGASAALMNNQLKKMSSDDPGREKLKQDFTQMRDRIGAMKQELYGVEKASLMAKLGFNDMGGLMKTVMGTAGGFLLGGGVEAIIGKVVGFFGESSTAAKDFETAISNLSAITGATGEDLRFYEEQAQLIGETTSLSAIQAVEAFKLIGSAKPELLANKEALAAVTQEAIALAEASGMDLPAAADSLTSALNQFGAGADEAGRYINVMAAGAKEGSAEIDETAAALKNAGTVAAGAKLSFEETNAVIQSLSEISIKGGEAGTGLRNVLLTLQSGADDTNPAVVGLETALDNLGKKNLSTAELAKMFGKENVVVAKQMVDSREKITQLTEAMTGTNVAYEQAATNMDNLEGDTKALDSATESLKISIGSGLNAVLRPLIQLFTAFILGIKEAPKFIKENKDAFIALGVAVLALNAANIKTAATSLYHTTVEKGRSVATRASALAQRLLNAAMNANPIGLVVAAVAVLVGGFVMLYNRSESVRAGINGIWESLKKLGSNLKEIGSALLSGDFSKIVTAFKNLGSGVGGAYTKGKNDKIAEEEAKNKAKEEVAQAEKVKKAEVAGEQAGDAENKGDAKAKKKRLEQEKKHQQDLQRARELYKDMSAKAELELGKLKIEIMDKGIGKVLAKLRFQHEQEIKEIEAHRQSVLNNIAITAEEKQLLLDTYAEQKRIKDEELKAAEVAAQEEEKARTVEEGLTNLDEEEALATERLEQQFLRTMEAEAMQEEARLEMKKGYLERRLADLEQAGLGETLQAEKYRTAILKTDKEIADGKVENAKKTADIKMVLEQEAFNNASMFLDFGLELLGQDEKARKKNALAIKAFTAGKIMVNLAQEVSGYMTHEGSVATFGVLGGIKAAMATVRAMMSLKQIAAQQFAVGGMTKGGKTIPMAEIGGMWQMMSGHSGGSIGAFAEGGWVNNAQLGLIGERGRELVLPNWMVESPKYANIVGYLESERQKGVRAYADGGSTGAPIQALATQESGNNQAMLQMLNKLDELKAEISAWPTKLEVHNNVGETRDALKVLNDLEKQAFG